MKNNSIFYTPGQVASFYSVKKDTLLFYDRIGLFSPSLRKENGYRYYSADQLSELDTILTLRDLDFSIPDIKDAIADLNTPSFISLLEKEEESIRKKISSYKALLNVVNTIKSSMREACEAEKGKLYRGIRHIQGRPAEKGRLAEYNAKPPDSRPVVQNHGKRAIRLQPQYHARHRNTRENQCRRNGNGTPVCQPYRDFGRYHIH